MSQNEEDILRQLLALEEEKLQYIKKVGEETASLAKVIGDGDMDGLLTFIDERQEQLDNMENADVAIRQLLEKLSSGSALLFRLVFNQAMRGGEIGQPLPLWAEDLRKTLQAQKELLHSIMSADGDNQVKVAGLLEEVRQQINAVKKNKNLVEKYAPNADLPVGSVLNKKE